MICPKCSKDNPPGSRFCAGCGAPLSTERTLDAPPQAARPAVGQPPPRVETARPVRTVPAAPVKTGMSTGTKVLIAALGVAVLALLAFIAWKLGPWQAAAKEGETGVLQAEGGQPGTGVLQAQGGQPDTGVLQAEGKPPNEPIVMPPEIEDWLKHLERTEKQRVALTKDAVSSLLIDLAKLQVTGGAENLERIMAGEDPIPPGEELGAKTDEMRRDWYNLTEFFRSKPPPPSCRKLANTYDGVLVETGLSMLSISEALASASNDPEGAISKLQRQRGDSREKIDLPAASADTQVAEICRQYNKDKWFVIHSDVATQLPSIGGGF
jgi:hypothetical protein